MNEEFGPAVAEGQMTFDDLGKEIFGERLVLAIKRFRNLVIVCSPNLPTGLFDEANKKNSSTKKRATIVHGHGTEEPTWNNERLRICLSQESAVAINCQTDGIAAEAILQLTRAAFDHNEMNELGHMSKEDKEKAMQTLEIPSGFTLVS